MCLLSTQVKPEDAKITLAYKVMKRTDIGLFGEYVDYIREVGVWYTAKNEYSIIHNLGKTSYTPGFHVFLYAKDAYSYIQEGELNPQFVVVEVEVKDYIISGYHQDTSALCAVFGQMKLPAR